MAYLRGESYVDGSLTVAGALKVTTLKTDESNLVSFTKSEDESIANYIVKFKDNAGKISKSSILSGMGEPTEPLVVNEYILFANPSKRINVIGSEITLTMDEKGVQSWVFS